MTYAAAILQPDKTYLHQKKQPDTVDVWLAPDMAHHIAAACVKPGTYHVVVGDADLTQRIITRKHRSATWPYTIPERAWAPDSIYQGYSVTIKRGEPA